MVQDSISKSDRLLLDDDSDKNCIDVTKHHNVVLSTKDPLEVISTTGYIYTNIRYFCENCIVVHV